MTNIAITPISALDKLPLRTKKLKYPMQFGSASNDNITTLTHVAYCTINPYLPVFHVGPESITTMQPLLVLIGYSRWGMSLLF